MKTQDQKTDIYQRITDIICDRLAAGLAPWQKPAMILKKGDQISRQAVNVETGKEYQGINALVLGCSSYELPVFGTFKQIQKMGGQVLRGAKSLPVIYWEKKTKPETGEPSKEEVKSSFILKYYNVFNISETSLDSSGYEVQTPQTVASAGNEKIESCEQIIEGYKNGPELINRDSKNMYYSITFDQVNMPAFHLFEQATEYYHIFFHELIHSTRHPSRLNRAGGVPNRFGSEEYSKEELTAEIGASFLSAVAEISSSRILDNSTAYLQSWLKALKNDKMMIFQASGEAQKAVKLILGEPGSSAR